MKPIISLICVAIAAIATTVFADEKRSPVERDLGKDHFTAGCPVKIGQPVAGDVIAAGCNVDVEANVGGDAALAGGHVTVNGNVGQGLYAVGGQLAINGAVGRNARVAGGHIEFGPKSEVAGNISIAGGEVTLKGSVKGYVQATGGQVLIDGVIAGDVETASGKIELGPNARIGGKLRYASRDELKRDPAAQVAGAVEKFEARGGPNRHLREGSGRRGGGWLWTTGLLVLAAVLVAALPGFYAGVAESQRTRIGFSLLLGFVAFICVPVAALLFLITLIGIPLGLLTILLYLMLLVVGYVSTGICLGDYLLKRFKADRGAATSWRIGAAVLGVLVVALLARIPWIGGWIVFVALLAGLGALMLQAGRMRKGPAPVA
ncbi:MAG: polymer-forming cytoskeletal protein [Betaproteobacteria bacterium]